MENAIQLKPNDLARQVSATLNDPRGWAGDGKMQFVLVKDAKKADFVVEYRSSAETPVSVSGDIVVIDAATLSVPAKSYSDAIAYQHYLVNHGTGLWLGKKPKSCLADGKPAPVMAPQWEDDCAANPWP
jgi:hypothetical protein